MSEVTVSAFIEIPGSYPDFPSVQAELPRFLGCEPGVWVASARVVTRADYGLTLDAVEGEEGLFDTAHYQIATFRISGTRRVPNENSILTAVEEEVTLEDGTTEMQIRLEYDESTLVDEQYDTLHAMSFPKEGYKANANVR